MAVVVALVSVGVIESFHEIYGRAPLVETTRAAAVIVALIPQGLWVMTTVTYAVAIVRMSPRGTLVQRLNAIESMSHVDVLCLDKTGTITTNALTLEGVHALAEDEAEVRRRLGVYAASATISNRTNDAIRQSIPSDPRSTFDEVPFESVRKWSALALDSEDMRGLFVLGAPEVLAPKMTGSVRGDQIASWTEAGLRVLLFAQQPDVSRVSYRGEEPELPDRLIPLGFVVLRDELRPGARDTIAAFADAGIALKIISGDHPATVAALAREAGVRGADTTVSGLDLEDVTDDRLEQLAVDATVFGRVAPMQKSRLVAALQQRGHYVAMIGDGVNDVPALKRSQVAISFRAGSEVTRSIADMLLLDDSFSALPVAFTEGRRIRTGMSAIVRLFLTRTLSVVLVITAVALLASEFPLTPRQSAILSALTVGIPALFIAAWARPGLTNRYLIPSSAAFVAPAAALIGVMGVIVYESALHFDDVDTARTAFTAAAALAGVLLIPFVDDPPRDWMRWRGLVHPRRHAMLAAAMLALFGLAMLSEPLRRFYELEAFGIGIWAIVIGAVAAWTVAIAGTWRLMQRTVIR
jgi:cation-transporting ATPase E